MPYRCSIQCQGRAAAREAEQSEQMTRPPNAAHAEGLGGPISALGSQGASTDNPVAIAGAQEPNGGARESVANCASRWLCQPLGSDRMIRGDRL